MRKTISFALFCFVTAAGVGPAAAQSTADNAWKVTFAPYFMGAAMSGATAVAGQELTVDVSASDIFANLQFGAMGLVVARKGNWGVGGDALWMSLGANGAAPGPVGVTGSADMSQGGFAFYGLRRMGEAADLFFGGRVNYLSANLRINAPLQVRSVSDSKTWFDPIVGLQLHTPANGKRWHAQIYAEVGGFGVGSTFTWQVFPTLGFSLSKRGSLELGYRWLDIDYKTGENTTRFKYDVLTQGPIVGFAFKF